jgi:hypothetical protein
MGSPLPWALQAPPRPRPGRERDHPTHLPALRLLPGDVAGLMAGERGIAVLRGASPINSWRLSHVFSILKSLAVQDFGIKDLHANLNW